MKRKVCSWIALALPFLSALPATASDLAEQALVIEVVGTAQVITKEGRRPVAVDDFLPPGSTLEVGPASRVILTFAGKRYVLQSRSRARLGKRSFTRISGEIQSRPEPPWTPQPIAREAKPGTVSAAMSGTKLVEGYPDTRRGLILCVDLPVPPDS